MRRDRGVVAVVDGMRLRRLIVRTVVASAAIALVAANAAAAVIGTARLTRRGAVVELHFGLHGRRPVWNLSRHGNELWVDLSHARIDLPPRPFYGHEVAPVEMVRAIDRGGRRSRLVIRVAGKTDYAIGLLPGELLIRLAPAGKAPNIGAPVLVRTRPPRRRATARSASHSVALSAVRAPQIKTRQPRLAALGPPAAAPATGAARGPSARDWDSAGAADESGIQRSAFAASVKAPINGATGSRFPPGHPLVVIDPGHGGYDSGTDIAAPLLEKNLAFQISMRLKNELEKRGIHALLTRTGDYFLSLPQRTAFANRAGADLFISIHLNSSPDPAVTGIETYYLNNTTDRATIRLARMENSAGGASYGTGGKGNLHYILSDMRQQYKANESVAVASMIEAQTAADLDASLGLRVNALGAKRGPFYVLVGAKMPAVLVECGFLSNHAEAKELASARYQEVLAEGIAEAVAHYFNADAAVGNL